MFSTGAFVPPCRHMCSTDLEIFTEKLELSSRFCPRFGRALGAISRFKCFQIDARD
jgi:hypothetical protein